MLLNLSPGSATAGRTRVYRGATVLDGTGASRFLADVVVEGGRIVAVVRKGGAGPVLPDPLPEGTVEVIAVGLAIAPGFIDLHAHSDLAVLCGVGHEAKLLQGVTTEVIGQDGLGYAPLDERAAAAVTAQIAGWNGPARPVARTMAAFLEEIDSATAGNVAVLVPQGNLRMMVVGHENRPATPDELTRMGAMLGEALDAGAFGMSSGLTYTPGMYADTTELEYLCRIVAERGGYWAPHTRSYGGAALEAYAEALEIGRRTGCPVHLTHATMNFPANRGRAGELIALVDAAVQNGVDVTLDTYPYLPGATTLAALLPSRLSAGGDLVGAVAALDEKGREAVRGELEETGCDGFHGERADWSLIEVSGTGSPDLAGFVGRTIAQIAAETGRRAVDVVLDTVVADAGATGVLMHIGDEDNVRAIMRHPRHAAGSDGILVGAKPHPRGFGTFPRYLGRYVRELGVLGLEEAVRHLSGTPAERLGLHRGDAPRGVIRPAAVADLVLFDPARIADVATFDAPRQEPSGIVEVLVAGVPVVRNGRVLGAEPGRALRKPPPAHRATIPFVEGDVDPSADPFLWGPTTPLQGSGELARIAEGMAAAGEGEVQMGGASRRAILLVLDPSPGERADAARRVGAEAFRIEVSADGVQVRGSTPAGVFRGVVALRQLRDPGCFPALIPAGEWEGAPAHAWRGVMLDVARHFHPPADLHRFVDELAALQLNTLHLHLTDDQGWRFEVPGFPRLVEVGARREATQRGHGPEATVEPGVHEGHYTAAELRALVAYAAERFVTIVPEVELPGHVQAALAAYPELGNLDAAEAPRGPWERFGVNPRVLAPTEAALAFGHAAIDALCEVFDSPWIGIGGDEVPVEEWERSPSARARMTQLGLEGAHEVQPWFTSAFVRHVNDRGRIALAWDEVLEGEVPAGMWVAAWRGPVVVEDALSRGIPVVACPDLRVYLDYRQSEGEDEPIPVGPPLTLERVYSLALPEGVAGGQANVWTEHLPTRERVDFALFPRMLAAAERLWLGGAPGPYSGFAARLETGLRRLEASGVAYRPLDGPSPEQRQPGVPGKPISTDRREEIVADLVQKIVERRGSEKDFPNAIRTTGNGSVT